MRAILQLSCLLGACVFSAYALAQEPNHKQAPANDRVPQTGTGTDPGGGSSNGKTAPADPTTPTGPGGVSSAAVTPKATAAAAGNTAALAAGGPADAVSGSTAGTASSSTTAAASALDTRAQAQPPAAPPAPPDEPTAKKDEDGWHTVTSGYFRAPMMVSLSERQNPGDTTGPSSTQMVFAPNRLVDANYSSFGFTRLQEGDWGEIHVTEKKKHIAASLAFMGYWYPWAGYERTNTSWVPSQGWVSLDSDFELGSLKPHIEFKAGVFWQRWGMFGKYDTYMFGRFHQVGEALQLTVPLNPDLEIRVVHGLGSNRNGAEPTSITGVVTSNSISGILERSAMTGLTLLHYAHAGVNYKKMVDVGLYYNNSWTKDPTLFTGANPLGGGQYIDAKEANMTVLGADVNVNLPTFGHLWLAPSYLSVKNGWALSQTVEVMHSPGGRGIAQNYMGWTPGSATSSGSGSMFNLGFLYENSFSKLHGQQAGVLPDLTLNVFGMMANVSRDRLEGATIPEKLHQFKWGADCTLQTLSWLAFMLRYDWVNLDLDNSGYNFSAITPRVIFSSHFLSNESIWIQYSRYAYGDKMLLPTSAGQPYANPDQNVIKMQANMWW